MIFKNLEKVYWENSQNSTLKKKTQLENELKTWRDTQMKMIHDGKQAHDKVFNIASH